MSSYALKIAITAIVVVAVSEIAKRSTVWGALLASLPLTSILAFVWLYIDTRETAPVAALASNILWLVLPSLVLFIALPMMLRAGWNFWISLALACLLTAGVYLGMVRTLTRLGIVA
ncbi:MAG TPA: DUF3147 family protein [Casimicrobiaceae bacterium]|nr:DUF3147 family protein [Casimicrobiaceae bacterium]